jgi:D-alanyl-D-alanine carboxypeptidase
MSRRNKRKRQRFIVIITSLLIILFLLMFKTINGNIKEEPETSTNLPSDNEKPKQNTKDNEITEIKISSGNNIASTGETIDLSNFKIEAVYKSGKTEEIKENISFTSNSDILKIENDKIVVSDNAITADSGILTASYEGYTSDITIKVFNVLQDNINEDDLVTNVSAYDMIVNKSRNLPSSYVPEDLVPLDDIPTTLQNPEVNQLRKVAYEALKEMFLKAKEEKSYKLYARSGYRSYYTQVDLYNSYVANHGQEAADKFSAKPGQSEHQTGLAMDITCESMNYLLDDTFFDKEEGKWVAENAHRFGFIIRYPKGKEDITGYQYEPWHLRYVGETLAKEIYESQLTIEEFFEQ